MGYECGLLESCWLWTLIGIGVGFLLGVKTRRAPQPRKRT